MNIKESNKVIDRLGGTSAVARLCKVKPASVSGWRRKGIPDAREMFLRLARPDAFVGLSQYQGAEEKAA